MPDKMVPRRHRRIPIRRLRNSQLRALQGRRLQLRMSLLSRDYSLSAGAVEAGVGVLG